MTLKKIIRIPVFRLRIACTFLVLFTLPCLWAQQPFSKGQVLQDLDFLKASLEATHCNPYAYTTEQRFDSTYREIKAGIAKDSLNLLETTSLFQQLASALKNGHTEIDFPGQAYIEYANGGGTVFPLELAFEADKALVRKNWSGDKRIEVGAEVLRINGRTVSAILERIYPQVSAERPYFKNAKIELYSFPRYYWQVFGGQDDFEVEIRSGESVETFTLKSVPAIEGYEMKREEVLNTKLELAFFKTSAYLNPGGFGGDEAAFRHFVDSSFSEIRAHKSQNLIIDLRNNPGGDNSFSDYLVSYIADKPFYWNSTFTLRTSKLLKEHVRKQYDTTMAFWKEVLSHEDGALYQYSFEASEPKPASKRFAGRVYVLINRQSHSQSAVTAAQIQDYGFGTLVGEETGEYPSLYASQFSYSLPQTGIPVKVSKGHIIRVNGSTKEEGVIPDIAIRDHLLDEDDEILSGLLRRID